DRELERYVIRRFDADGPGVRLRSRLVLEALSVDAIQDADITLRVADVNKLRELLPRGTAPWGWSVSGPLDLAAWTRANHHTARLTLADARVQWGDTVDNRAGVPMHVNLEAERRGERMFLRELEARLGGVTL